MWTICDDNKPFCDYCKRFVMIEETLWWLWQWFVTIVNNLWGWKATCDNGERFEMIMNIIDDVDGFRYDF